MNSFEIILVPSVLILLGYVLKHFGLLESRDSVVLSKIVLNITLPALLFINLVDANITESMLSLPLYGLMVSFVCLIIALVFSSLRGYSKSRTWTIMIACAMMNTGFLGFPIVLGVFGDYGFIHAIFFDLSTTILFVVFGILLVSRFGGDTRTVFKHILSFIPLWAVILALVFNFLNIGLPFVINNSLNYLSDATIFLIMISLGLNLDFNNVGEMLSDSIFVSIVRLVVSPLIIFMILMMLGVKGMGFNVAVLESGMATAMNAMVLSLTYDLDTKLMSSLIFTDTVLCLCTLTVIITVLT